jgi:molecular chaperone DnaK
MKLGEAMLRAGAEDAAARAARCGGRGSRRCAEEDDVVDAEFTEVDDDKKNKKSA